MISNVRLRAGSLSIRLAIGSIWLAIGSIMVSGCNSEYDYRSMKIEFLDDAPANTTSDEEFGDLVFQDLEGNDHPLSGFSKCKSIVLVITRGNTPEVCPFCSTQVARLIHHYQEIAKRNAEVVVIYPVERFSDGKQLNRFLSVSRKLLDDPKHQVPFPILLDRNLINVDKLGIRKQLSKPATYIVEPSGRVRYAYVGESLADRPSVSAIINELEKLIDR
jgi:peroxiredoxin